MTYFFSDIAYFFLDHTFHLTSGACLNLCLVTSRGNSWYALELSCLASPSGKVIVGSKDNVGLVPLGKVGEGNTARSEEAHFPNTYVP